MKSLSSVELQGKKVLVLICRINGGGRDQVEYSTQSSPKRVKIQYTHNPLTPWVWIVLALLQC